MIDVKTLVAAACKLGGCKPKDLASISVGNPRVPWSQYKRALVLAMYDAGYSYKAIAEHVGYTMTTLQSTSPRWRDIPEIAEAAEEITARAKGLHKTPLPDPKAAPSWPRSGGDFGTYYGRRMASGGVSMHLPTKHEAERRA